MKRNSRDFYLELVLAFPLASIKSDEHLMEAKNVTQAQLSRETQLPKSTISEVLSGRKPFSRLMIRKLADYLTST